MQRIGRGVVGWHFYDQSAWNILINLFYGFVDVYFQIHKTVCVCGSIVRLFVPDAPCPCPLPEAKQKIEKYSCFTVSMNGDTLWCSDKYYSLVSICVLNTVIILFPRLTKPTLCHCKVDLTHIVAKWGVSLDSFPPKALNGSHSPLSGVWGWTAYHVFVCLICISIALLSFEWFVFKHEFGLCKHTQTCKCTHWHTHTDTQANTRISCPTQD